MTNSSTNYGHASGDDVTTPPKQDKGNMQMVNTLTTDLVYQIFGYLSSRDLLRLGITCKDWCELVLDWPPFWKILDKELKLNPALHEYVINILRHQETVHLIETPAVPQFAKEYWLLLVEMLQRDTTILEFNEFEFNEQGSKDTSQGLQPVLKSAGSSLKKIVFKNCEDVPYQDLLLGDWLVPCTNLNQLSLPRSWPWPEKKRHTDASLLSTWREPDYAVSFISLIHLQLSISPSLVHLVPTILRRSPNLESLALDSDDYYCLSNTTITTSTGAETKNIDHGNILQIVYEACPNLQWMSLVPCASARTTFYEDTLDNEDYSDYGLYGLSLCGKYLQLSNPKDIYPLLKKNHSTLRSLHLVYDGSPLFWYTLYYLGQLGVPKLRELSLNTLDGAGFHTSRCSTTLALSPEEADKNGGNRTLSFEQVFLQLIKRAPPLQSMHFDADGGNIPPELRVTEAMFAGLAKRQSQSRLLRLTAMHCCQPGSLTQFSRTPSTRIEQLTCDCNAFKNSDDLRQLLKKAQKLWAFQTLHVSSDQLYDPLFDPARMTIRLRSFFDGSDRNDDCDCVRQKIFTPQERSIVKQILNLRDPNYASL